MPRVRTIQASLNAGEQSPLLSGRVDQDKYFSGCSILQNFIPTVQGPARRRGGTRFVGRIKTGETDPWLMDFVFSAGQSYILEFGDQYIRFWVNRAQLLSGMSPYEIATPYLRADLATAENTFALRYVQLGDIVWIVHAEGKYPPYRLARLGATNWTLTQDVLAGGPFRDVNLDDNVKVKASAVTGTVTLTATAALFTAAHVGMMFYMESADPSIVTPYQSTQSIAVGAHMRNDGKVYEAMNSYTYVHDSTQPPQRYPPVHTEGEAWDGAVRWKFLHAGYGWVRITAVASGTSATATVLSRLPDEVVVVNGNQPGASEYTRRWAWEDLSELYGWPTNVAFFRERLVYARGTRLYLSTVGDYANFAAKDAGEVTKETAMRLTLAADKLDSIRWLAQSQTLLVGSPRAEFSVQEQTSQAVFAADNYKIVPQTEWGARLLPPLRSGDSVLFVDRAGGRVRAAQYAFEVDRYKAEDLTVLSEHVFDGSELPDDELSREPHEVVDWTYQQQRDSLVWHVRSDGVLVALLLNTERRVVAWAPQPVGGAAIVRSARVIPAPDNLSDDLWLIVEREIDGDTVLTVEFMEDYRLVKKGAAEAYHVDGGTTYRGAPTTTITGLSHLEGVTVAVCVDGARHPDRVVTAGSITLDYPASLVHVGHRMVSRYRSPRLEIPGLGGGTTQTTKKGVAAVWLRLHSTIGGGIGPDFNTLDDIPTMDPDAPAGTPPVLFGGDVEMAFPNGYDTDGYVCYEQRDPLPATLVAIILRVQVND